LANTVTTTSSPPIARAIEPRSGVVAQTRSGLRVGGACREEQNRKSESH
jgi:hypothetical protein